MRFGVLYRRDSSLGLPRRETKHRASSGAVAGALFPCAFVLLISAVNGVGYLLRQPGAGPAYFENGAMWELVLLPLLACYFGLFYGSLFGAIAGGIVGCVPSVRRRFEEHPSL